MISSWTCSGDTTNVAAWEAVPRGSTWRGAWKTLPCLLWPMKENITTPGYNLSPQTPNLYVGAQWQKANCDSDSSRKTRCRRWLAWDAPVHILHGSSISGGYIMDHFVFLLSFFCFPFFGALWGLGSSSLVRFLLSIWRKTGRVEAFVVEWKEEFSVELGVV